MREWGEREYWESEVRGRIGRVVRETIWKVGWKEYWKSGVRRSIGSGVKVLGKWGENEN